MEPSFKKRAKIFDSTGHEHGRRTRLSSIVLLSLAMVIISVVPTLGENPIRVAILPFQIHSAEDLGYLKEGIYDVISSRLAASGEIDVIGKSTIEGVLAEMRPPRLTEEVAREAGARLRADYVVLGSITKIGDFISLDARLMDIKGQKPPSGAFAQTRGLDQLMGKVDEFARDIGGKILGEPPVMAKEGEVGAKAPYIVRPKKSPIVQTQQDVGFQKSQKFPFEIKGLDIADVDGDGKNEIVLMDTHNLWIYHYIEERLRLFKRLKGKAQQDFLTLDVADVNGNGTAEIFVTGVRGEDLNSFILEYEQDRFKSVGDKNRWYFRVLDLPRRGPTLLAQRMGLEDSFSGPIYQFAWKKNRFSKDKKLKLPKGTQLFGLAIADITGDGKDEIIQFDHADYLRVLSSDGKDLLYRTPNRYGGTDTFLDRESVPETGRRDGTEAGKRVYLQGRILVRDLDGDGKVEVIVNKNHSATGRLIQRVRLYDRGEIYDLVWDGLMLAENWRTREIPGFIADYQVEDFDNDGQVELVVAMVSKFKPMQRSKESHILFFELF
jgi:TolB-like protein